MLGTSKRDKILNPYRKEAIAAVGRYINAVAKKHPELKIEEVQPHSANKNCIDCLEAYFSISGDAKAFSEEIEKFSTKLNVGTPRGVLFDVTTAGDQVKVLIPQFYTFGTDALEGLIEALNSATDKLKFGNGERFVDVQARRADRPLDTKQLGM